MSTKSIRLSEETYQILVEIAGKLQIEKKKPVSIEDTIKYLIRRKISDLGGAWEMTDDEVYQIKDLLKKVVIS